jgi:hypothetical protein
MDKDEREQAKNEPDEEAEIKKKPGIGSKMNHQSIQGQTKTTRKMNLRTRRIDSPKEKGDDGQMKRPMMLRLNSENSAVKSVNKSVLPPDQTPTPTGVMTALSSIFPTDDASGDANPFEQQFKKAQLKDDNTSSSSNNETKR